MEFDEVDTKKGSYTILNTSIHPKIAELKARAWAILAPPMKPLDIESVKELEKGPIWKRYKIKVKTK